VIAEKPPNEYKLERWSTFMSRTKRYLAAILMTLSLGFLMGDDCEFDFDDFPGVYVTGWDPYPYDVVVVDDYYDPYWW
jgi:hypothetical protein